MKMKNSFPLFFLLLLSGCLLTGAGYAGKNGIYASYNQKRDWRTPVLSLVFQGMKDDVYPWMQPGMMGNESAIPVMQMDSVRREAVRNLSPQEVFGTGTETEEETAPLGTEELSETGETETDLPEPPGKETEPAFRLQGEEGPGYDRFGNLIKENEAQPDGQESPGGEERPETAVPGQEEPDPDSGPETDSETSSQMPVETESRQEERQQAVWLQASQSVPLSFVPIPTEYFDDALFIGDSRTVGLGEYGGFQESTTFYAATSLTIYNIFRTPKKVAHLLNGKKATVEEALTERQFGKIYIMLGINEIGMGTTESFFTAYADVVNRIRLLQPNAIIYIQGIMRVSGQKSRTDAIFNNERINERNQALAAMADGENIFYLEINDAVCDENGDLIGEYTFDQIHLKAKYYQLWKDYLFSHGIVKTPAV